MSLQVKSALEFERKDPLFFSGEQIKGIVHLESESELHLCFNKDIFLSGDCTIKCNEKKNHFDKTYPVYCSWCRDLDGETTENTADEKKIFKQKLKFQIQLIDQLPTSCNAKYGFIEYKIFFIMRMFKREMVEHQLNQPITIIRALNPNNCAILKLPWQFDPVPSLSCTINQASFVPGEWVHYMLTLSKHFLLYFIKSITISLQEVIDYQYHSKSKKLKKLKTRNTLDQCEIRIRNCPHEQYGGTLSVPKTTVTSFICPVYADYKYTNNFYMKIHHVVNIKVNGRYAFKFSNTGYDKSITIATIPMIKQTEEAVICDTSKTEVEKSFTQHYFECLPVTSSTHSPKMAFIPMLSTKEESETNL